MQENILVDLPLEIWEKIFIEYIDTKNIARIIQISKYSHSLFSDNRLWKRKIMKDFGIDQNIISSFNIQSPTQEEIVYKNLYLKLFRLEQNLNKMPKFAQKIYEDKIKLLEILFSSLNSDYALKNTPTEKIYSTVLLNIYAGDVELPLMFAEKNPSYGIFILYHALVANNEKLITHLLKLEQKLNSELEPQNSTWLNEESDKPEHSFTLKGNSRILKTALANGNLKIVKYLIEPNNKFELKLSKKAIDLAASSGNVELIKFLLDPSNNFMLIPDVDTLQNAVLADRVDVINYLLNIGLYPDSETTAFAFRCMDLGKFDITFGKNSKFDFHPTQEMLQLAATEGSLEKLCYLLDSSDHSEKLTPSLQILEYASLSGSLKCVKYLLDPNNNFKLTPNQKVLSNATKSGNIELFLYLLNGNFNLKLTQEIFETKDSYALPSEFIFFLLNPINKFELIPTQTTLKSAIRDGSLKLFKYLLDPANDFNLKVDNDLLNDAITSDNLEFIAYIIDPVNGFKLVVDDNTYFHLSKCEDKGITHNLMPSWFAMNKAIESLQANHFNDAYKFMERAHQLCSSYFKKCIFALLSNSKKYALNQAAVDFLSVTTLKFNEEKLNYFCKF